MVRLRAALAASLLLVGGCAGLRHPQTPSATVSIEPTPEWTTLATQADQQAVNQMTSRWHAALARVSRGARQKMDDEGALVDPKGALEFPTLPPGAYRCRLIRFGGKTGFATFPPDICYVSGNEQKQAFTKQTGSSLPGGWIYPDTPTRSIFLGTYRDTPKDTAAGYGYDPEDDVAGVVERVGPFRWRMSLTRSLRGAALDVYELVPITPEVPGEAPVRLAGD